MKLELLVEPEHVAVSDVLGLGSRPGPSSVAGQARNEYGGHGEVHQSQR